MGCISFNDLTQFIHELQQGRRYLDRRLVRMAEIDNEGFWSSPIHRKHVIATARVGLDIIRLDIFYSPYSVTLSMTGRCIKVLQGIFPDFGKFAAT